MRSITKEMIKIYNLDKWCFMGYKLDKNATFHHIVKKEHGGKEEIDNGAVLNPFAHQYLHIIEYKDMQTYNAINKILKVINNQHDRPTKEQLEIISCLLRMFEEDHAKDKSSKGKRLIKHQYLDRYY